MRVDVVMPQLGESVIEGVVVKWLGEGGDIAPVVAKMTAEHGLDVLRIQGTGIDGRVTKKDVEEYLARGETEAAPAAPPKAKPAPAPPPPKAKPSPPPPPPGAQN